MADGKRKAFALSKQKKNVSDGKAVTLHQELIDAAVFAVQNLTDGAEVTPHVPRDLETAHAAWMNTFKEHIMNRILEFSPAEEGTRPPETPLSDLGGVPAKDMVRLQALEDRVLLMTERVASRRSQAIGKLRGELAERLKAHSDEATTTGAKDEEERVLNLLSDSQHTSIQTAIVKACDELGTSKSLLAERNASLSKTVQAAKRALQMTESGSDPIKASSTSTSTKGGGKRRRT